MSEHDDYLFDPTAAPDPEVVRLEQALRPLRWGEQPWRDVPVTVGPRRRRWWPWLAAAAVVLLALGVFALRTEPSALRPDGEARTFVAAKAPLPIALGQLAEVTLHPGSELRFVHWRPEQALFALVRGGLSARVLPPPAVTAEFFVVDTPLGRVIDQGCRYDLVLRDDGNAEVRVTEGAVTFRAGDREVFVPVGASLRVTPRGPCTPCFDDASPELQKSVREFDQVTDDQVTQKGDATEARAMALKRVLMAPLRPRDSLVLWHLLLDANAAIREVAEAELLALVGPPVNEKRASYPPEEWLPFLRLRAWQ